MGVSIAIAAGVMGALGVVCAVCLGVAGKLLAIAGDPRVDALEELFGGTNCGACGFASCRAAAEAVVSGEAAADICELGGAETAAAAAVIVGEDAAAVVPVAVSDAAPVPAAIDTPDASNGDGSVAGDSTNPVSGTPETGDEKPRRKKRELPPPVPLNPGEIPVIDDVACIACGLCVRACTDGAIVGEPKTIPTINLDNCTLCGACVVSCRKGFISVQKKEDAK